MTVVIIGTFEMRGVADLADSVRRRGFTVLALESMSLVALIMLTERVAALIVHQARAPTDWEATRAHISQISSKTNILYIPNDDPRSAEQLACDSLSHLEE